MKFIYKILSFALIFAIVFSWTFNFPPAPNGWPQIRINLIGFLDLETFPPPIKKASADFIGPNTVIFVTSTAATTWTAPNDWNNASNTIEVIGAGGGGRASSNNAGSGGGGGGAYAKITNATSVIAGATVGIGVGTAGAGSSGGSGTSGGATWLCFENANCGGIASSSVIVGAAGGAGATDNNGAAGGASSTISVGTTKYKGGNGGGGNTGTDTGGGGGGGAGPNGDGCTGGTSGSGHGGGGGGGAGGGSCTSPSTTTSTTGTAGGKGYGGALGGAGSTSNGANGSVLSGGGAGGGGGGTGTGGWGASSTFWTATNGETAGPGGGGGGITGNTSAQAGHGGPYGAGGAGGEGTSGNGGQGIIVITYTPASTYEQSAYKWYANNNSSTPGMELTAGVQDASTTLASTGDAFRLRILLHVGAATSSPGSDTFKLQYASTTPGNCNPAFYSSSAFTDVDTATGEIRFNNNAAPNDGDIINSTSTDPAHSSDSRVNQTYEEQNNFTVTSTISAGADGKWDFSLIDFSAPGSTTYCFRTVQSDGTFITTSTLSKIPEITTTAPANTPPSVSSVVLNGGSAITLTPNTTTSINLTVDISDVDGCADITSGTTTVMIFRSGITSSTCQSSSDNLNCYVANAFTASSTCSGGAINATTTFGVWYFAQATDASSSFSSQNWKGTVIFKDPSNTTGTADSSGVELNTLLAINVTTSTINYGTITASSTTGATNQTTTITNAGNASTSLRLSTTKTLTFGSNSITTSSQRYATSTFTFPGGAQQITDSPITVTGFLLTSPTSTVNVQKDIFWGLEVPTGNPTGTYNGFDLFTSLFQP